MVHGKTAHESTVAASAVATKEATDEDSNMLRGKTACENAVAIRKAHMFANDWRIRKPAGAGNGYRLRSRRTGVVRTVPLKGEVSNHKGNFNKEGRLPAPERAGRRGCRAKAGDGEEGTST